MASGNPRWSDGDRFMNLIGVSSRKPARDSRDEVFIRIHQEFFTRIAEIPAAHDTLRIIRFTAVSPGIRPSLFLGAVVPVITTIPPGMTGWEITDWVHREYAPDGESIRMVSDEPVHWNWQAVTDPEGGTIIGEFSFPADTMTYELTAVALHSRTVSDSIEDVSIVGHDPSWKRRYEFFADLIKQLPGAEHITRMEHFGSTSIPGMPAKPVIDILAEVPSFPAFKPVFLREMVQKPWDYWWYDDHFVCIIRDGPGGARLVHLHVTPPGHRMWDGIRFRDYLIAHPAVAEEYADLKKTLAEQFRHDREAYTKAKGAFIHRVLRETG